MLPFTTHRIRLQGERYTASRGVDPEIDVRTELVVREADGSLDGKSVLDLGCLEGGFALELARRGARPVFGIEYRDISVQRCQLARDLMGLTDTTFECADITTAVDPDSRYDIVFAAGILYHLADPMSMLELLARVCTGFMLLDTHVADPEVVTHGCSHEVGVPSRHGGPYMGRWFGEFAEDSTVSEREQMLWASSTNARSFWPYEHELERMLRDAGFGSVDKVDVADARSRWQVDQEQRVMYVCRPTPVHR